MQLLNKGKVAMVADSSTPWDPESVAAVSALTERPAPAMYEEDEDDDEEFLDDDEFGEDEDFADEDEDFLEEEEEGLEGGEEFDEDDEEL